MGIIRDFKEFRAKGKKEEQIHNYFKMFNAYAPTFTSFEGGVYEYELTRAAIHCVASHCAKFKPEIIGSKQGNQALNNSFQYKANDLQNTYQYLYKLATILQIKNTACIIPIYDESFSRIAGFYPINPKYVQLIQSGEDFFYKFNVPSGEFTLPSNEVGILNQYLYNNEVFGETNEPIFPTVQMLDTNKQGIINGIKNSGYIRFVGLLSSVLEGADKKALQDEINEQSLGPENSNGIALFDSRFKDVKQIESKPYTINAVQQREIEENVYNYFGVNKKILQNDFTSESWNAFYEGKIEGIAIQMSLTHSNMLFTERELSNGNKCLFTTNRLQYLSPTEKLNIVQTLFDRKMMTANQGARIFGLPADIPDGDKYFLRREYAEAEQFGGGTAIDGY